MKKLLCLFLAVLLLLPMAGCKNSSDKENSRYTCDLSQYPLPAGKSESFTGEVLYRDQRGFLLRPWREEYRVKYGEWVWVEYKNNLEPIPFNTEGKTNEKIVFRDVRPPAFPLGPLRIMEADLFYPIGD